MESYHNVIWPFLLSLRFPLRAFRRYFPTLVHIWTCGLLAALLLFSCDDIRREAQRNATYAEMA